MRNIFLFIRRYFVFISFLVFQFIALWMLFTYNRFHTAAYLSVASEVTGHINTQYDKVDDYFHLREENKRVHHMNDSLLNLLHFNFYISDTSKKLVIDSTKYDTLVKFRRYLWREAKVVNNSVASEKNYLQINRGAAQGIKENMAVVNSDGAAVGVVVNTSENFSEVMSLLHIQSRVTASLKKTGDYGTLEWDAQSPYFITLRGISKNIDVKRGDTVVTSMYSYNFPPGLMVGTIANINSDPATGFYDLKVRTAAKFNSIQQVFVIENLQREEQMKLEKDTEKKIEQEKRTTR